jgi:AhpD family alkylhydroperoxidase
MDGYVASPGAVSVKLKELAQIKVAMVVGCPFWIDIHSAVGRKVGVTEEQLRDLSQFETSTHFSELEQLVLRFTVALSRTPADVSEDLFAALRRNLSERQMVELASAIAWENYRSRFNRAFAIEADGFSEGQFCPLPERSGSRKWEKLMNATQAEKAALFQKLHAGPGLFVIPNPWDAGTARILEHLGFKALTTTSAGLAFALGRRDGAGEISRDETLANAKAIVDASNLPVAGDLENGFGDAPEAAAETIGLAGEKAGLVGGSIEDASGNRARPIYDFQQAVERVAAAAEAARALPFPFVLVARAENFLHGRPDLEDTIRRLQAFEAAGADALYAPGLTTSEDIRTLCQSVTKPVNVVMGIRCTDDNRAFRSGRPAHQSRLSSQPRGAGCFRARRTRGSGTGNV